MSAPTSSESFPVETTEDILSQTTDSEWTNDKPDRIDFLWNYDHNDRVNYPNPALYVYSPTESTNEKFSIDGNRYIDNASVEIIVMTLDALKTKQYAKDAVQLFTEYFDDNNDKTNFIEISPDTDADLRNEHVAGTTDHYLSTVELSYLDLKDSGI